MVINEQIEAKAARVRTHLSADEIEEILELARNDSNDVMKSESERRIAKRNWAVLCVSFNHGLRVSECVGGASETKTRGAQLPLQLSDLDMKNRQITIRRLKGSDTTTQPLEDHRGKPALSDYVALKEYLKVRIDDGSQNLFVSQKGSLQRWTLTRMFREYCQRVSDARVKRGLKPIPESAMHFHTLKHSIATILASKVSNIFLVKSHLGHASIGSTMCYCSPDPRATGDAVHQALMQAFSL